MPATYQIRVQGILDDRWSNRLGGVTITTGQTSEAPVTSLSGRLVDQAALLGVLNTLHDLRLPLLSVEVEDWEEKTPDGEVAAKRIR
jgi:hypothetical protein